MFFFKYTATTEIYTLSLHDALPIFADQALVDVGGVAVGRRVVEPVVQRRVLVVRVVHAPRAVGAGPVLTQDRSEEHTSELQSRQYLVCRLLLEKKTSEKSPLQCLKY